MFVLTKISDLVQIIPQDFRKRSIDAIKDNLNEKYSNKVIQNAGLAICLFDILQVSDGLIGQDASVINVNVEFRLIMFHPFKNEIIVGKISSSSEWGIKVRLDFFEDIHIPKEMLFPGSVYKQNEGCWTWVTNEQELFYDKGEWVKIRIEGEEFFDNAPPTAAERVDKLLQTKSPYSITASMMQPGLGPIMWWDDTEA